MFLSVHVALMILLHLILCTFLFSDFLLQCTCSSSDLAKSTLSSAWPNSFIIGSDIYTTFSVVYSVLLGCHVRTSVQLSTSQDDSSAMPFANHELEDDPHVYVSM